MLTIIKNLPNDFETNLSKKELKEIYFDLYKKLPKSKLKTNYINNQETIDLIKTNLNTQHPHGFNILNDKFKNKYIEDVRIFSIYNLYPNITKLLYQNGFIKDDICLVLIELLELRKSLKLNNLFNFDNNFNDNNYKIKTLINYFYGLFNFYDVTTFSYNLINNLYENNKNYIINIDTDEIYFLDNEKLKSDFEKIDSLLYNNTKIESYNICGLFLKRKKYILFDENEKIMKMKGIQKI